MNFDYSGLFWALRPEIALIVGALLVLSLDLSILRKHAERTRLMFALWIGALAVGAAAVFVCSGPQGPVFGGVLMFDSLAIASRLGVLLLTLLAFGVASSASNPRHSAEFISIILFATSGFLLMAATQQLLLAFLALELASLSLYILAGFDKTRPESAEAGVKYFLFGGMAAAFLLFGLSLVYGLTGSIQLPEIAMKVSNQAQSPLLMVALVMILVAFGFKTAAAPFHLWSPDVYEGAPTASASLIASASKLASFAFFTRLLWAGFFPVAGSVSSTHMGTGWLPALAVLAVASMFVGNLGALAQRNFRRLLAYSAIAHSGALILGVIAAGEFGPAPLFYYATTYGLATVGAFGVIAVVEASGSCQNISDLAGLHKRSPFLAACLAIYILSLAGIPPLAGFFGKFSVFSAALRLGGLAGPAGWLVVLAIAFSAVALYYYLIVLKQALVSAPPAVSKAIAVPPVAAIALAFAAALIVALGIWPTILLDIF